MQSLAHKPLSLALIYEALERVSSKSKPSGPTDELLCNLIIGLIMWQGARFILLLFFSSC